MRFTTAEIAAVTGGTAIGEPVEVDGIALDSRRTHPGELFVAIRDVRDGHDFIADAMSAGAAACLTERAEENVPGVLVEDCRLALQALARRARDRLEIPVIAITGSVGKTTTKELTAAALAPRYRTHASIASFNNELGIPHTLLSTPDDAQMLVVEIGTNAPGEVAAHCAIVRPTTGVVTRVAPAHTEGFGDVEAIAREKGALIASLPASGLAILNQDDPRVAAMRALTDARALSFGSSGDVRVRVSGLDPAGRPIIGLDTPWGAISGLTLALHGAHQASNAAAAVAVAASHGVDLADIAEALETVSGPPLRMDLRHASSGALVLDDSYNANPASMEAALRTLASLPAKRHFAVLGVMTELGERGPEEHLAMAALAAELGIELVAVGTADYGVEAAADIDTALIRLADMGQEDAVLVKASRRARLDVLAERLRNGS
jgi:UDP-N-acetylmuramoyl-tripeptide--D-alanyl-D-alanine ligase